MKRGADFGCAVIRQGEPAAEQYKRRRKDGHGQNGHHEPQPEQCTGALGSNGACLLGIAGQPDQIQADAGQKTATPDAAFTTKVCIEKITLSSRRPVLSWP